MLFVYVPTKAVPANAATPLVTTLDVAALLNACGVPSRKNLRRVFSAELNLPPSLMFVVVQPVGKTYSMV